MSTLHDLANDPEVRKLIASIPVVEIERKKRGPKPGTKQKKRRRSRRRGMVQPSEQIMAITNKILEENNLTLNAIVIPDIHLIRSRVIYELREARVQYKQIADLLDGSIQTVRNQRMHWAKHLKNKNRNKVNN